MSSVIVGAGPAHAVYFGTYEAVKELAGGNVDEGHHPFAAGEYIFCKPGHKDMKTDFFPLKKALSGASATIASDALMNPFDGMNKHPRNIEFKTSY